MVRQPVGLIGTVKLAELKVRDVDFALGKLAQRLSSRSVRLARMILIQAIRNAMVNDLVLRNVADLAAVPTGEEARALRWSEVDLEAGTVGHSSTRTTEVVYGHQLRPVTRTTASALGPLFVSKGKTDGS
jgi:hypothetical protein